MVCFMGAEPADCLLWLMVGVVTQTEEKDELPALWSKVEMRERGDINQLLISHMLLIV